MKIHIVDGTYELFRSYYGAPSATDATGREVGATRGLLRTLVSLLRQSDVTHVGCAFDHVIESFRNDLFEGYKTGEGVEPALRAQFELAERAARALGVVVWPMIEFEADDALATAAARFKDAASVEQIVICSPDKDLAQCVVGDKVVCLDRRRRILLDERGVRAKFGVPPESIPDYLALVGDAADGFPGLSGWGPKTAATVLARFHHLEQIPREASEWKLELRGGERLAGILDAHREEALLYRRLATLRTDVPLDTRLGDLRWRGPARELAPLARELGEDDLLSRLPTETSL